MFYRGLLRPLLYCLPAEAAHRLVMVLMRGLAASRLLCGLLRRFCLVRDDALAVRAFGRALPTPIGLAAGLDKQAEAVAAFEALGFGFVEVGTVTARPQPGNPRPRLFRLVRDRALVNRMGFNNDGAQRVAARLDRAPARGVLGVNIGKSKVVAPEQAGGDYADSARLLGARADYLVINVSSPNTPGLRDLQAVEALRPIIAGVQAVLAEQPRPVPLLIKIAPDLADEDIDALADLALECGLDGIIATNTTVAREGLHADPDAVAAMGEGGLSGAPLRARALAVLRRLRQRVGDRLVLIGVGGIETVDDVWQRLQAGATLVQIYTALIYEGPLLPHRLAKGLARRLRAEGYTSVTQVTANEQ